MGKTGGVHFFKQREGWADLLNKSIAGNSIYALQLFLFSHFSNHNAHDQMTISMVTGI